MRKAALNGVLELARQDSRVCLVASDLSFGSLDDFRAERPSQLFREGISEQHIIGQAAGLALGGRVVYVNAIAAFLTRRSLEQVILDLAFNRVQVRLIASGGGLVYAPLGPTHLATDDLALMRSIPGLTVLAPCDAYEMKWIIPATLDIEGPVYIRLAKGGDRVVSPPDRTGVIGRAVPMLATQGRIDTLFITCGICAQIAISAAQILKRQGMRAEVLHNHTIKPLDKAAIIEAAARSDRVFSVEEHVPSGGLGSAVAELLAESEHRPFFRRLSLPDAFFNEHGSQNDIMKAHGLTAEALASAALAGSSSPAAFNFSLKGRV